MKVHFKLHFCAFVQIIIGFSFADNCTSFSLMQWNNDNIRYVRFNLLNMLFSYDT